MACSLLMGLAMHVSLILELKGQDLTLMIPTFLYSQLLGRIIYMSSRFRLGKWPVINGKTLKKEIKLMMAFSTNAVPNSSSYQFDSQTLRHIK